MRGLFSLAASPFAAVSERIQGVVDVSEKEKLKQQVLQYEEDAAEAASLRQENDRLRKLLNGEQSSFKYAPLARIVAPVGGQFTDRVVINIGTNDGVKPEQPVVVGNNILVGRTTDRVTPNTAEVLLITDQSFAAGVRIVPPKDTADASGGESTTAKGTTTLRETLASTQDSHGEGLLRTNWEGYLGVDYVDLNAKVEQGDFVITSGRAGDRELLFPPGLLIGTVESVSSQDIDQYKKIVVTPVMKPEDLQEVRVIINW